MLHVMKALNIWHGPLTLYRVFPTTVPLFHSLSQWLYPWYSDRSSPRSLGSAPTSCSTCFWLLLNAATFSLPASRLTDLQLGELFIYMHSQIEFAWPLRSYICWVHNLYRRLFHRCGTRQIPIQAYAGFRNAYVNHAGGKRLGPYNKSVPEWFHLEGPGRTGLFLS